MSKYISLAARLREALTDLEEGVNRAVTLGKKAAETNDDGYWDGVAFNLDSFYTGAERIFRDIALTVDGSLPETAEWHRDLLYQISAEVGGRPAVITRDTRHCLQTFLNRILCLAHMPRYDPLAVRIANKIGNRIKGRYDANIRVHTPCQLAG